MTTYIVLLRAVNLGGYGKLSMGEFRKMLEGLGYKNVETYIQSGNAVFDASGTAEKVVKAVSAGLEKLMGTPTGVVIRTHADLERVIKHNPFVAEAVDGTKVHVAFLSGPAGPAAREGLDRIVTQYPKRRDRYHLDGDTLYLHLPEGAAETKFTGKSLDRAMGGVIGTARNWNTVLKLHAMSKR
jgi:uncharacterized protein (DUF1697 family)